MGQYAYFNSNVASPSPVLGWYDNTVLNYPNMPSTADLFEVTADEWANRLTVSGGNTLSFAINTSVTPYTIEAYTITAPVLTLPEQAQVALNAGVAVVSNSVSGLNGVYAIDATTQGHLQAEMLSIVVNGTFADGTDSISWPDTSNTVHTFSVAQFKTFAMAIGAYVAALYKVINGTSVTLPSSSLTIA